MVDGSAPGQVTDMLVGFKTPAWVLEIAGKTHQTRPQITILGGQEPAPPREQRGIAFIGHMDNNSALLFIMRSLFFLAKSSIDPESSF